MAHDEIRPILRSLGLNEKEIILYLMLLQLGTAPASLLGDKTGISRSTAQYTCQQLTKKGLISMATKANTFLYTAEPPEKLLYLLHTEQEELERKETRVNRIIGTLKAMINPDISLPKVQFYEGKKGIIQLYEKILELQSPIDSFEDKGEMTHYISEYVPQFIKKRKKLKILNRVICPDKNEINIDDQKELREVRVLPTEKYPFSCDIKICKDQVSIFSFENTTAVGIAIHHKEIAKNFRLLFQALWEQLKQ